MDRPVSTDSKMSCKRASVDIVSGTNRIKPKYMGLDSVTSRVVVNGKLANKKAISRRAKYTAFLRFPKRFCGADFIDNLIDGNIKVRDSQAYYFQSEQTNLIYRGLEHICKSVLKFDFKDTVKDSFTGIYKYKKHGPQSTAIIQFSS